MDISRRLVQLVRDRGGNFGIITASIIPLLVGLAGISIDVTRGLQVKAEMQGIADSAVLAAATSLSNRKDFTEAQAKDLANTFYATQIVQIIKSGTETEAQLAALVQSIKDATTTTIVTRANGAKGKIYDVSVASSYTMPVNAMTAVLTGPSITLGTRAASQSATESQNAFSMYLVLDQSGSMNENTNTRECNKTDNSGNCISYGQGYVKKIAALKTAVKGLLSVIDNADPAKMYARVAAVSYNENMQPAQAMTWGTNAVEKYTQALTAGGYTNSGEATELAYNTLAPTGTGSENAIHQEVNKQTPSKFIILMTDGENRGLFGALPSADKKTKAACDRAKSDSSNKIVVYSVAFMAPTAGQTLLKYCASTSAHYFNAENSAELAAAFKSIGEAAAKGITRLTQ